MTEWVHQIETIMAINHGLLNGEVFPCPITLNFRYFTAGLIVFWVIKQIARQKTMALWVRNGREANNSPSLKAAFLSARANAKLAHLPRLYLLDRSPFPAFTCGVFRPKIFLESSFMNQLTATEQEAVLTHEMMHIRRRDNLRVLALEFGLTTIPLWMVQFFGAFFIQSQIVTYLTLSLTPLFLLLGHRWLSHSYSQKKEILTDRAAAKASGAPLALASALLKVWQIHCRKPRQAMFLPVAVPFHNHASAGLIERRIRNLLHPRKSSSLWPWLQRTITVFGLVLYLTFAWKFYVANHYDTLLKNCSVKASHFMAQ